MTRKWIVIAIYGAYGIRLSSHAATLVDNITEYLLCAKYS